LTYRATVHNGEVMLLFARISSAETNPNVCRTGLTLASHGSRGAQGVRSLSLSLSLSLLRE